MDPSHKTTLTRRGRKAKPTPQNQQSLYECPCSRIYTSYPALYTHIKQNHDGQAPGLIKMPQNNGKRVGASKIQQHNKKKSIEVNKNQTHTLEQILTPLINLVSPLPQIIGKVIEEISSYQVVKSAQKKQPPPFSEIDSVYDVKIHHGVCIFFKEIESILKKSDCDPVKLIILLILEYTKQDAQDPSIIQEGSLGMLIDYSNYFIVTDVHEKLKQYNLEDSWFSDKNNVMRILDVFFKWMLYKRFTLTTVSINTHYNPQNDKEFEKIRLRPLTQDVNSQSDEEKIEEKKEKKKIKRQQKVDEDHSNILSDKYQSLG